MKEEKEICAVTGVGGYLGKYIAAKLFEQGFEVRALTNRPVLFPKAEVFPLDFSKKDKLIEALQGVSVLYITYWVRFGPYEPAVENIKDLIDAAKEAGVKRIIYISITNPSESSPLGYFRGKAQVEKAVKESGISYAILRPALLFGEEPKEGILVNTIAFFLRKLPVFGVFGKGDYYVRPIHVADLAELAVIQAQESENCIVNAVGPEAFSFLEFVKIIAEAIGVKRSILSVSPFFGFIVGQFAGLILRDIVISRDEIEGLMRGLLYVDTASVGRIRFTRWVKKYADTLGTKYASELVLRNGNGRPVARFRDLFAKKLKVAHKATKPDLNK